MEVSRSAESPSMVDPQWNIWYWGSKWNLHTVWWGAVGCECGANSVYFGITYVCFIPSRLPVFAVEPQYRVQDFLFLHPYTDVPRRNNNVVITPVRCPTSFWHYNDVIITPRVRWVGVITCACTKLNTGLANFFGPHVSPGHYHCHNIEKSLQLVCLFNSIFISGQSNTSRVHWSKRTSTTPVTKGPAMWKVLRLLAMKSSLCRSSFLFTFYPLLSSVCLVCSYVCVCRSVCLSASLFRMSALLSRFSDTCLSITNYF